MIKKICSFPVCLQVISQLRMMQRVDGSSEKFDREAWEKQLTPFLNLWRKLNQVPVLCCNYFISGNQLVLLTIVLVAVFKYSNCGLLQWIIVRTIIVLCSFFCCLHFRLC